MAFIQPQSRIERLVNFVRFHHLSLEYLANVVAACPLANESGLLPSTLRSDLLAREAMSLKEKRGIAVPLLNRGRGDPVWTFKSTLSLADLQTLDIDKSLHKAVGLADGYPTIMQPGRELGASGKITFGFLVLLRMPVWEGKILENDVSRCAILGYNFRVGTGAKGWAIGLFDGRLAFGTYDYFEKTWEEVVHENSAYFPGGQISIEVQTRVPRKEGQEE